MAEPVCDWHKITLTHEKKSALVRAVAPCPYCGAALFERCTTRGGTNKHDYSHQIRWNKAQQRVCSCPTTK